MWSDNLQDLNRRRILQLMAGGSVAMGGLGSLSSPVAADEGDILGEIRFPNTGTEGVSTTFTGEHLVVVDGFRTNEIDLYEPVQDGEATNISTKVLPEQISGITWDYTRGELWATEGDDGVFYRVDIGDPTRSGEVLTTSEEFTLASDLRGWPADGMAYDGQEDAIWWTYDDSGEVYKIDPNGTVVDSIIPEVNEQGDEFEYISGVAVGATRNNRPTLYIGDNATEGGGDSNSVVRVYADDGENIQTFADVGFRVEDITCDPVTYSPSEALLVKDANQNKVTAFEVEQGTCPVATDPDPEQLSEVINEYENVFKSLLAGQFRGQGRHHAVLYDEYGEAYGSQLVNFWGYKAGEIPEAELREAPKEFGDATLEMAREEVGLEYQESDATILFNFFDDMFATMASADTREERKQIGEQYYMGTHPDQSTFLVFDDEKTLAESVDEDWGLQTNIYEEVNVEDLRQDQIGRATTRIRETAKRLRRRGEEYIDSKEKAALELPNLYDENSKEIQAQKIGDSVDGNLGTQAIGTTILLATAAAGLLSFAGGYVTNKCASARAAAAQSKGIEFNVVDVSYKPQDNALLSAQQTGIAYAQLIKVTSESAPSGSASGLSGPTDSSGVETTSAAGAFISANFLAGAKAAAYDLGVTGVQIGIQTRFAVRSDGQITRLDLPDINDSTELSPLNSFLGSLPFIGRFFSGGGPTNGEATGTIEIENTGDVDFKPSFELDYRLRNKRGKFGSGFAAELEGTPSFISPGETQEYDITYQVPTDEGVLSGEIEAILGMSPPNPPTPSSFLPGICELDYKPTTDRATDSFIVNEEVQIETAAEGTVSAGNNEQTAFTPGLNTEQVSLDLNFEGYIADLHLFDENGNHVGYDYENGEVENEIEGATYSGRSTVASNSEWITFPPDDQTYTAEIRSPSLTGNAVATSESEESETITTEATPTNAPTAEFRVDKTEVPDLPPKLSVTPTPLSGQADSSENLVELDLAVAEANGDQAAEGVTLSATDLTDGSKMISRSNISFSRNGFDVADSKPVDISVSLPSDVEFGTYTGEMMIEVDNAESLTAGFILQLNPSIETYADPETGTVETDGLRKAIDHWRSSDINTDTNLLRDVIDAWRSSEPVV